jgi:DNA-binding response OmpR family regulator
VFRWLSFDDIPPGLDLRRHGWRLVPCSPAYRNRVAIAPCSSLDSSAWQRLLVVHPPETRKMILLTGVERSEDRARLLRLGFGDVLGKEPRLDELAARAKRLAGQADMLPRTRDIGIMQLDLVAREAFAQGRPLGLHPREFCLIWRLAETPDMPVSKQTLLKEVWQMHHVPESNSLAVHIARLRDKMRVAGLPELVRTVPSGGYMLALSGGQQTGNDNPGSL